MTEYDDTRLYINGIPINQAPDAGRPNYNAAESFLEPIINRTLEILEKNMSRNSHPQAISIRQVDNGYEIYRDNSTVINNRVFESFAGLVHELEQHFDYRCGDVAVDLNADKLRANL